MNKLKFFLFIIIGLIIAFFDYCMYLGWQWIIQYKYYCIEQIWFDVCQEQVCQIWFDLSPLPALIMTIFAIVITVWYVFTIFIFTLRYLGLIDVIVD